MIGVNLIPQAVQTAQARRRHVGRWTTALATVSLALAVPLAIDWYDRARADDLRAEHSELEQRLGTQRGELRALTGQLQEVGTRLERANALRAKRAWSSLLAMIGRRMPEGCWLTSIATDPPVPSEGAARGPAPHKNDPASQQATTLAIESPRMLRLAGYAADVAEPHEFVAKLKETGVFSRVVLERSRSEPVLDGTYFRFDLVCEW